MKKSQPRVVKYIGLSLSGGKQDKACISVMDYYPDQKRFFLSKIFEKIRSEGQVSADLRIHQIIEEYKPDIDLVGVDSPWKFPLCLRCKLVCPGYEKCKEPHILWMEKHFETLNKKKRPQRFFTPYTQRCVEMYLSGSLEEPFVISPVLGSNTAPLAARAKFVLRRLDENKIEVNPKVSVWRIGRSLGVRASQLRSHRHSTGGEDSRRLILSTLGDHNIAFLYEQDRKMMIENNHAFESFICAMTAFLKAKNQTENRPLSFPKHEAWIDIPHIKIPWAKIL